MDSPGESHSYKELNQTKRSTTKKRRADLFVSDKEKLRSRCGRLIYPREKSHDMRAFATRYHTESVKRGGHPYWARDATKWSHWSILLRRNL